MLFSFQRPGAETGATRNTINCRCGKQPSTDMQKGASTSLAARGPEGPLTRCRDGSYQACPRVQTRTVTVRRAAPGRGSCRPRARTSRRPPRKSSGAGDCRGSATLSSLTESPPPVARRTASEMLETRPARWNSSAYVGRSAAPSSSTVGASSSATSSSAGSASSSRPRPNSASDVRVDPCRRRPRRAPDGQVARQRALRLALAAGARAVARRAPRSPRARGTRTPAGSGPRRRRPG